MTERKERGKNVVGRPFKPGNPGRRKGSPNKFTTLKSAFLEAFERTGGADGLVAWIQESRQNRGTFYALITKLFPQEVAHSGTGGSPEIILKVIHTGANGSDSGNGDGDTEK